MKIKVGSYGKLPVHGDFVGRGLNKDFLSSWDSWLSAAIASSQEQLDARWLTNYLSAPVWHFTLSPGVIDQQGWAGLLMPSVDSVGRYYPLTLAWPIGSQNPVKVIGSSEFLVQLENVALDALEQEWNIEKLTAALEPLNVPFYTKNSQRIVDQVCVDMLDDAQPSLSGFDELLAPLLEEKYQSYSLWWSQGSQSINSALLCCQGLPKLSAFSSMLDGKWQTAEWQCIQTGKRAEIKAEDEVCL